MAALKSFLLLLILVALIVYEERVTVPSCQRSNAGRNGANAEDERDLKVMMVADLLLRGPDGGLADIYFRDSYTAKFFKKSFEKLKPDMLVVLGDLSAKGSELTNVKWISLLRHFQRMLGPFLGFPLHIVLGDRDVGDCEKMDVPYISKVSSNLPGLDSSGCGAFEISNISFFSLNAVALLCENNEARFNVEAAIERESIEVQFQTNAISEIPELQKQSDDCKGYNCRENHASLGSGPVLLLHFPLHKLAGENFKENDIIEGKSYSSLDENGMLAVELDDHDNVYTGPYKSSYTLPPNTTEYIFHALRPSIVFSAHSHRFLDSTHRDGTREVTVPAMTWSATENPGFVVATFGRNKSVTVSHCYLAKESHVLAAYFTIMISLLLTTFLMKRRWMISRNSSNVIQDFHGVS